MRKSESANDDGKVDYADAYAKYRDYQQRYREKHRDKYREYAVQYRKEHPKKLLGERSTQNIFETKDPKKLHKALQRELVRIGVRR